MDEGSELAVIGPSTIESPGGVFEVLGETPGKAQDAKAKTKTAATTKRDLLFSIFFDLSLK